MALFAEENEQTLKCFVKRKRLSVAGFLFSSTLDCQTQPHSHLVKCPKS